MTTRVYLLGGYQTDFADNWARNGMEIADMMRHTVLQGLAETKLEPQDIEVAHVGNFAAELFCNQGHLGGLFAACDPAFAGLPASRHEGACASGSLAMLAASADIEAGRYGLAAVVGIEQMRNVPGEQAAQYIGGPAMWAGHEYQEARYPWPRVFSDVADEYEIHRLSAVAENQARFAGGEALHPADHDLRVDAECVHPRTVHIEVAQRDIVQSVHFVEAAQQPLAVTLRRAINRTIAVAVVMFRRRELFGLAVNGCR